MGVLSKLMAMTSGADSEHIKISSQLLFDKTIGFRGLVEGVGCSTIVQNVAIALSMSTGMNIAVVDTSILYPSQYMLLNADAKDIGDLFDYGGVLSEITTPSLKYSKVYVLGFKNRTIVDFLSPKDSRALVEGMFDELKTFFDVVLVDLCHEPTCINTEFAIQCNKIITIADESLKSMSNLAKSMEYIGTLGVPFSKMQLAVINKSVKNVNSGVSSAISNFGMEIVGTIPLSNILAVGGVSGKRLYGKGSLNPDILTFNSVIETLVDIISKNQQVDNTKVKKGKGKNTDVIIPDLDTEENGRLLQMEVSGEDGVDIVEFNTIADGSGKDTDIIPNYKKPDRLPNKKELEIIENPPVEEIYEIIDDEEPQVIEVIEDIDTIDEDDAPPDVSEVEVKEKVSINSGVTKKRRGFGNKGGK